MLQFCIVTLKGELSEMEIYKKITPTCLKESIERKEKNLEKQVSESALQEKEQEAGNENEAPQNESLIPQTGGESDEKENDLQNFDSVNEPSPQEQNSDESTQNNSLFESQTPYPEIVPLPQNQKDIRIAKALNFGRDGELSSFLTYLFQSEIIPKDLGTLKEVLSQIASVELKHMQAVSNAIVSLGGTPNLTDGKGNVWTGRNVSTATNPKRILQINAKFEKDSIDSLSRAARETNNESLRQLYLKISEDEELHLELFEKLLEVFN